VYADAENAYGVMDCRAAGFETVPVAFNKHKDEGIENLARYFEHGKIRIADEGALQTVVRQLLRYHRNDRGNIVKEDDHGPDALLCAMLHFPFIDEFDTALSNLLTSGDRERLKVTNKLLDACIHDYEQTVPRGQGCSMGVSVGSSTLYTIVSLMPDWRSDADSRIRRAIHIGRVKEFADLDRLIDAYGIQTCVINPQPEPHLVQEWINRTGWATVYKVIYTNDGMREPHWDRDSRVVTVDRTYALNTAYEEIRAGKWWLPRDAADIDRGEFYARLKAPTRVRDMTSGELRYRWTETGTLDHYRHAHVFDHLAGMEYSAPGIKVLF